MGSVGLMVTGQRAGAVQVAGVSRCVCEQRGPARWGVTRSARPKSGHRGCVGPREDAGLFLEAGSLRPPRVGWTVWPGWRPGRMPLGAGPRGGLWGEWGPGRSEGRRRERERVGSGWPEEQAGRRAIAGMDAVRVMSRGPSGPPSARRARARGSGRWGPGRCGDGSAGHRGQTGSVGCGL